MARPSFCPTDEQRRTVRTYSKLLLPHEEIAHALDIAPHTLRKYFRKELDLGRAEAYTQVMAGLYKKAMGNDTEANIYLAERLRQERASPDTSFGPPQFVIQIEEPSQ